MQDLFLIPVWGELQLIYALGKSDQQDVSFTQSRIHIGYVARF